MGVLQQVLANGVNFGLDKQAMTSNDFSTTPANASAAISVSTAGFVTTTPGTDFQLVTFGDPTQLQIFVTGTGDTPTGSAVDAWLTLSAVRTWNLDQTIVGAKDYSGTYSIRTLVGGLPLGGNTFNMHAEEVV